VGINTAIASQTGAYAGYSLAVPSIIAKKVVDDLIEYGKVNRAALGVSIASVDAKMVEEKKLDVSQGVYVQDLTSGGGAVEAGMKVGDIIQEINGRKVDNSSELQEQVMKYSPGDKVVLKIHRKGSTRELSFKLKDHEANALMVSSNEFWAWLGADLKTIDKEELDELGISHGVRVNKIQEGMLKKAGMSKGFIITHILKHEIDDVQDVRRIIESLDEGGILIEGMKPNGDYDYYVIRK